jgi:hypothetical protein
MCSKFRHHTKGIDKKAKTIEAHPNLLDLRSNLQRLLFKFNSLRAGMLNALP